MSGSLLHALNTSTLSVARLKARFGEHFGRTPSYCACLTATERPEAIQSDLQGPRQAIVDYCNLKLFPSPESSLCYTRLGPLVARGKPDPRVLHEGDTCTLFLMSASVNTFGYIPLYTFVFLEYLISIEHKGIQPSLI